MKPTIIKTEKAPFENLKPTVIQSQDEKPDQDGKIEGLTPTLISQNIPRRVQTNPSVIAQISAEEPVSNEIKTVNPSRISGKARNRIAVDVSDLQLEYPGYQDSLLEKVLQYVLETDLDFIRKSSAMLWQMELQKQYSEKVMLLLECTQHEVFRKAGSQVARIIEILEAIDLRGVCEYGKDGVISKFLKHSNKEFDTPEELNHAERELKQLTTLLDGQLKALILLQTKLRDLNKEIHSLGKELHAASVAADFLAKFVKHQGVSDEKFSKQFVERSMSLTQTEAQILENEVARETQLDHPLRLISAIQNVVLIMIPDWLGSVTTIRSMLESNKRVTITEVEELSDWKKKMINQLN